MSEYQYYEFVAVDRPLTARRQAELRALSTRAQITATSFTNHYEWGDFKGDPRALMGTHFDAHLYLTSWGTRQLMFRLPAAALGPATAARYCRSSWKAGTHVVVDLTFRDEEGEVEFESDGPGLLGEILPARAGLAAGDLRLLYLGWLLDVQLEELDDDEPEPPVPTGLARLDGPLTAAAEFLCLDPDLIAAAAAGTHAPRTAGMLRDAAARGRDARERRAADARRRGQERRELSAAAERQRHLDRLAVDQIRAWHRVADLIKTKTPRGYDEAVQLLIDLRDVSARDGAEAGFQRRIAELRAEHTRKPALQQRLTDVGLDA